MVTTKGRGENRVPVFINKIRRTTSKIKFDFIPKK